MTFSVGILSLLALTAALDSLTAAGSTLQVREEHDFRWLGKRCCINCDNPYAQCGSQDKREAVETEGEAVFGNAKHCCINCMDPCSNCSCKGPGGSTCHSSKRSEGLSQWPSTRCCILCDNPYARCGARDKREAVDTIEEALFVLLGEY